jgi:hypothetical protein
MSKVRINKKWLSLTEETNALDYLGQAHHYIQQTEKKDIAWKWVILTLHGALYGFAICACRGTSSRKVIYKTRKKVEKLISFDKALERCQDPNWMRMTATSKHLQLSNQQDDSIQRLKEDFRNNFEHFIPKSWLIELHGMPKIAIDVLEVIRFLALDTGNYVNLSDSQKRKLRSIVFQSKRILEQSQLHKEYKLAQKKEKT